MSRRSGRKASLWSKKNKGSNRNMSRIENSEMERISEMSQLSVIEEAPPKQIGEAEVLHFCGIWTDLQQLRRRRSIEAAPTEVDFAEWRKLRRHPILTTDPRKGLCQRQLSWKVKDTDLVATRKKLALFKPVDSEICFRFVDIKGEPRRLLEEVKLKDAGISAFSPDRLHPVFACQWFAPSVRMQEAQRDLDFDPAKRHPATAGFIFKFETPTGRDEKKEPSLDPKACTRKELVEELLLPQILKHLESLLHLVRHEFRFDQKRGKVNACDFLAFRLYLHNPNHPQRLQSPLPHRLSDVPFFASIPIRDLSCESRKTSAEQLLADIIAADLFANAEDAEDADGEGVDEDVGVDDEIGKSASIDGRPDGDGHEEEGVEEGEVAEDQGRVSGSHRGSGDCGSGASGEAGCGGSGGGSGEGSGSAAADEDADSSAARTKRESELAIRKSETFYKLAGKLKDGEIFYYQRLLTRQLDKEEKYRQRHKFTRKNRFYRVLDKSLEPDEAATIIQRCWKGYIDRKRPEIQELIIWQKEWRIIRDVLKLLEPRPSAEKPPADPPEPFCWGEELRCRCDCGGGAVGEEVVCRCVPGKGHWKQPPPTSVPNDIYKKEKFLETQFEGHALRLSYVERGKFSSELPSLLFLHGLCAKKSVWRLVQRALADEQQDFALTKEQHMIALDLPGHGHSSCPFDWNECTSDDEIIETLLQIINHFIHRTSLAEGAIHLVGHSFGGSLAILFTKKYPAHVKQLTLVAPVLTTYPRASALARGLRFSSSSSSSSYEMTLRSFLLPTCAEEMELCLNHLFFDAEFAASFSERWIASRLGDVALKRKNYKRMFDAVWRQVNEVNRALPKITQSSIIIWGLHDHFVDVCGAGVVQSHLVGKSRTFILPDAGHGAPEEAAQAVARNIALSHSNQTFKDLLELF